MGVSNEGLSISSQPLAALGMRGIELGLDIYAGQDDEGQENPNFVMDRAPLSSNRPHPLKGKRNPTPIISAPPIGYAHSDPVVEVSSMQFAGFFGS
jgi:hypothetical protein